jgi:hypothetical protein
MAVGWGICEAEILNPATELRGRTGGLRTVALVPQVVAPLGDKRTGARGAVAVQPWPLEPDAEELPGQAG